MSLLAIDGFDNYASGADMIGRSGVLQWSTGVFGADYVMVAGRYGGRAMNTAVELFGTLATPAATMFIGFAMQRYYQSVSDEFTINFNSSASANYSTTQVYVVFSLTSGSVKAYRKAATSGGTDTLIGQSPNNTFAEAPWNFVEFGLTVSPTNGYLEVRINNVPAIQLYNINTAGRTDITTTWDQFTFSTDGTGGLAFDDLYITSSATGPGTYPCNGFMGDCFVDTVYPTGNSSVSWTPLANANWQEVSEAQMDSDTSYNYSTTTNATDLFTVGSLSRASPTIYGVQVMGAYRKDDAGSHTVANKLVSGSANETGTTYAVTATYGYSVDMFAVDPSTSASWTPSGFAAITAGYELLS